MTSAGHAQSVEAVLRGVQERQMAVSARSVIEAELGIESKRRNLGEAPDEGNIQGDFSEDWLIQWPGGIARFPADGTIVDLSSAIAALNHAILQLETLQYEYLRMSIDDSKAIKDPDDYVGYLSAKLVLPSIGRVDAANWRQKVVEIASQVEQFKVLPWPALVNGASGSKNWFNLNAMGDRVPLAAHVTSPLTIAPSDWVDSPTAQKGDFSLIRYSTGYSGSGWQWGVVGGGAEVLFDESSEVRARLHSTHVLSAGIKMKPWMNASSPVPNAPNLGGKVAVYKKALIMSSGGDMTEKLNASFPAQLPLDFASKVGGSTSNGVDFLMGDLAKAQNLDVAAVYGNVKTFLGLPDNIPVTGGVWNELSPSEVSWRASAPSAGSYGQCYHYTLPLFSGFQPWYMAYDPTSTGSEYLADGGSARVELYCVAAPNFSPLMSPLGKLNSTAGMLATVEPRAAEETVRVHLGRGVKDLNQTAWLGWKIDGFGSPQFTGSPHEFELVHETDAEHYEDPVPTIDSTLPRGTVHFPESEEFTAEQKAQSGWSSRLKYVQNWHLPRLRQVKGGELLVNIAYPTSYQKVLTFYWARDAGEKDSRGFYSPPAGKSFKTVTICNPSVPLAGGDPKLPTDVTHLVVVDNGISHWLAREEDEQNETVTWKVKTYDVEISLTSVNAPPNPRRQIDVVSLLNPDFEGDTPWEQTSIVDGVETRTELVCYGYYHPSYTDKPVVRSVKMMHNGVARTVGVLWNVNGWDPQEWTPAKITYAGAGWAKDGEVYAFGTDGMPLSERVLVDDKLHEVLHQWNGLVHTRTDQIAGQQYRTTTETYVPGLQSASLHVDGTLSQTIDYEPTAFSLVKKVTHAGDYVQSFERIVGGVNVTVKSSSGWGANHAGGVETEVEMSRFGALVSEKTYGPGRLELHKARVTSATAWGAAKEVTFMRGAPMTIGYREETASAEQRRTYGTLSGVTDAYGNQTTYVNPDWLLRPASVTDPSGTYNYNRDNPLQVQYTTPGEKVVTTTFNPFGDMLSHADTRGSGLSVNLGPNGGSVTADGRSVSLDGDGRWGITGTGGGMGSRGSATRWSAGEWVAGGGVKLCATTTLRNTSGGPHFETKTWFDGHGRPLRREVPSPSGDSTLAEIWSYNDAARSVTYQAGPSPAFAPVSRQISYDANAVTVTIKEDGIDQSRAIHRVENNQLTTVHEVFDNSSQPFDASNPEAGKTWVEVSREAYDPATGISTSTPWALSDAATKFEVDAPGVSSSVKQTGGPTDDRPNIELEHGRIKRLSGSRSGVAFNMDTWTYTHGKLSAVHGTVGDVAHGLQWDTSGRMTRSYGLGYDKSFQYGGAPGYQVTSSDSVTGLTEVVKTSTVGDLTEVSGDVNEPLFVATTDLAGGGSRTTYNGSLAVDHAANGALLKKNYDSGGLVEEFKYAADGTLEEFGKQPAVGLVTARTNREFSTTFDGIGTVTQTFSSLGARRLVASPAETRSFTYVHGLLAQETHLAGSWQNWEMTRSADSKGRITSAQARLGNADVAKVSYVYDAHGRISTAGSTALSATYTYDELGRVHTCSRGPLTTTWTYDNQGRLDLVNTSNSAGLGASFDHNYNPRGLRVERTSQDALSWSDVTYDGRGRLRGVNLSNGNSLAYNYDARGNRVSGGGPVTFFVNGLDQLTGRTIGQRGYGVRGKVAPGAKVRVFHPQGPVAGEEIAVDELTGVYQAFWLVASGWNGGGVSRVEMLVRGTLEGAGNSGSKAVSDQQVWVVVPGVVESYEYDGAGRMVQDDEWHYSWNGMGHLTTMLRKLGTSNEPGLTVEFLTFTHDSDGRRVKKLRVRKYASLPDKTEGSAILWDGWLPMFEDRVVDGVVLPRRRFVWGLDITGTLGGAGGIGGLLAIEEQGGRILLPIHDGLGNITRVVDKASGSIVAEYAYGPYGEMVGQSGDVNACPFRYQSKYYDAETGLSYFGFRYYSAKLGRWISRDPLGESGGFNLYGYCGNDPVNRWDYLGMDSFLFGEGDRLMYTHELREARERANAYAADYGGEEVDLAVMPWEVQPMGRTGWYVANAGGSLFVRSDKEIALTPDQPVASGWLHSIQGFQASVLMSAEATRSLLTLRRSQSAEIVEDYYYKNYTFGERGRIDATLFTADLLGPSFGRRAAVLAGKIVSAGERKVATYLIRRSLDGAPIASSVVSDARPMGAAAHRWEVAPPNGKQVTVLGSLRDTERYKYRKGFNVLNVPDSVYNKMEPEQFDMLNAQWLNGPLRRGEEVWLVTNPLEHTVLMLTLSDAKGRWITSRYLELEIPMLNHFKKEPVKQYLRPLLMPIP